MPRATSSSTQQPNQRRAPNWTRSEVIAFLSLLCEAKRAGRLDVARGGPLRVVLESLVEPLETLTGRSHTYEGLIARFRHLKDFWKVFVDAYQRSATVYHPDSGRLELSEQDREIFLHQRGRHGKKVVKDGLPIGGSVSLETWMEVWGSVLPSGHNIVEANDDTGFLALLAAPSGNPTSQSRIESTANDDEGVVEEEEGDPDTVSEASQLSSSSTGLNVALERFNFESEDQPPIVASEPSNGQTVPPASWPPDETSVVPQSRQNTPPRPSQQTRGVSSAASTDTSIIAAEDELEATPRVQRSRRRSPSARSRSPPASPGARARSRASPEAVSRALAQAGGGIPDRSPREESAGRGNRGRPLRGSRGARRGGRGSNSQANGSSSDSLERNRTARGRGTVTDEGLGKLAEAFLHHSSQPRQYNISTRAPGAEDHERAIEAARVHTEGRDDDLFIRLIVWLGRNPLNPVGWNSLKTAVERERFIEATGI